MPDARANLRLEIERARVRGDRRVEQAAIPARAHQAGQQLRVGGVRALDETDHRVVGATEIHLELREQLVGDRQIGIEIERPPERRLRVIETLLRSRRQVLGHHVMDPAEARPRGRVVRIFLDALQVQIARDAPLLRVVTELVAAQKVLVGRRRSTARRAAASAARGWSAATRARRRCDASARPGRETGRRPASGPSATTTACRSTASVSCVATRISRPERSSVPVTIASTSASAPIWLGADRIAREPGRRHARSDDQRLQAAERAGERVGQAEGEELGLGVRPQHAERQHDESRHADRLRQAPSR